MLKICRQCQCQKQLDEMKKSKNKLDGRDNICNTCHNENNSKYRLKHRLIPKSIAKKAWYRINERALNARGDLPSYAKVEVRMTEDEFLSWAIPRYQQWMSLHPGITPSINRIDPNGHYEISNINMVSWYENAGGPKKPPGPITESRLVDFIIHKCAKNLLDPKRIAKLLLEK